MLFGCLISVGIFLIIIAILASIKVTVYLDYQNTAYGFKMKYPGHWTRIDKPEGGAVVAFVSPKESDLDTLLENLNISFHDLSVKPLTLEQFSQMATFQLTVTFGELVTVVTSESAPVSRYSGYKFVYDVGEEEGKKARFLHYWIVERNKAFIFTYFGKPDDFNKNKGILNKMLGSFELI